MRDRTLSKKLISGSMVITISLVSATSSFASNPIISNNQINENINNKEIHEVINQDTGYHIISSEKDFDDLIKEDEAILEKQYKEKSKNISKEVIETFDIFASKLSNVDSKQNINLIQSKTNKEVDLFIKALENNKLLSKEYKDEDMYLDFITSNPSFETSNKQILKKDLKILRDNFVEEEIKSTFISLGFPVSYRFFVHSLTPNPKPVYYDLIGYPMHKSNNFTSGSIYPDVKYGCFLNGLYSIVANYARAGNGYETTPAPGGNPNNTFKFENGDLALAIHGIYNLRLTRTMHDKAYFRLFDVYDFSGIIEGRIYNVTSTTPFNVTLYGLWENGTIK